MTDGGPSLSIAHQDAWYLGVLPSFVLGASKAPCVGVALGASGFGRASDVSWPSATRIDTDSDAVAPCERTPGAC